MPPCDWFPCTKPAMTRLDMVPYEAAGDGPAFSAIGNLCLEHAIELGRTLALYRVGNIGLRRAKGQQDPAGGAGASVLAALAVDPAGCAVCGHLPNQHKISVFVGNAKTEGGCYIPDCKCQGFKPIEAPAQANPYAATEQDPEDFPQWVDQ